VTTVTMPLLGEGVTEGTIGRWLRHPGERVERDEPLVEVVTDKVNAEIPSPVSGVLAEILVEEGSVVAVSTPLAVIHEAASTEVPEPPTARAPAAAPESPSAPEVPEPPSSLEPPTSGARATPAVRRLAEELGVELGRVPGRHRRVTRQDVLAHASAAALPDLGGPGASPPAAPSPATAPSPDDELLAFSRMRQGIAAQMTRSLQVPHAYITFEIDMTAVARRRAALRAEYQGREGISLGVVPFVVKAVVESLRRYPDLNAHWSDAGLVRKRHLNIGIAVAVDDGLLVPVIHDADQLSLNGLNHALIDLAARARDGRLRVPDLQGGTFTVDNAGWFGSLLTQPILNIPEIVIVTMDAIVRRPVVRETPEGDTIAIRSIMNMCAGFDHRATDGAQVGRFLANVRDWLESVDEHTSVW
jgi:2-oxoisovalerate dehydrogenase E2 component (dihydrolipoyl transacylase)